MPATPRHGPRAGVTTEAGRSDDPTAGAPHRGRRAIGRDRDRHRRASARLDRLRRESRRPGRRRGRSRALGHPAAGRRRPRTQRSPRSGRGPRPARVLEGRHAARWVLSRAGLLPAGGREEDAAVQTPLTEAARARGPRPRGSPGAAARHSRMGAQPTNGRSQPSRSTEATRGGRPPMQSAPEGRAAPAILRPEPAGRPPWPVRPAERRAGWPMD